MAPRIKERYRAAKAYFLATQAVSRPIALLMAFFALALLVSASTGIFLLGRWGYRRVVNVDSPAVVSAPKSNDTELENSSMGAGDDKPEQSESPTQSGSQLSETNNSLPNTGTSPAYYLAIFLLGVSAHQMAVRKKLSKE
jgi:hypothetical protein